MIERRAAESGKSFLSTGGPSSWWAFARPGAIALTLLLVGVLSACDRGEGRDGDSARDGQGSVRLDPAEPIVCGSWGTWRVEWTAGPDGLDEGGGVVLQVSPFWGWSPPQTDSPGHPGWTTVGTSASAVYMTASAGAVPMTVVATSRGGRVEAGETVTFTYGDASAGEGGRARADRYAEAREELLIKTDGDGDGFFVAPLNQPTLRILPESAVALAVATPTVVEPGAAVAVAVHGLDRFDNRTPLPGGRLVLSRRPLRDGAGDPFGATDTVHVSDVAIGADGVHGTLDSIPAGLWRIEAHLAIGPEGRRELAGTNELLLVESGSPFAGILWGDLHAHSSLSDGTGIPSDLYAYARDVAGLDVACVTDHDAHGMAPLAGAGWDEVRDATGIANEPGRFVAFLGYEWTSWTWGHRNVYYPTLAGDVFPNTDPASDTPAKLWALLAPHDAMTIPHHPGGGPIAIDWSIPSDAELERVVEICSIHGSSEAPGVESAIYRPVPGASVRDALDAGHRLGIIASGDTHDGHPGRRTRGAPTNGLVAFRAATRTRAEVWRALVDRRVYGTSGPRILLASDWGGMAPGTELADRPSGPIAVRVVAPEPVQIVEIIGPSGTLGVAYGGGRRVEASFRLSPDGPLPAWIYVRVVLGTGEAAWDSPWWTAEETR